MRRFATIAVLLLSALPLLAQRGARTTVYPTEVYPGDNIITVTSPSGIDRIRYRNGGAARITVPPISGCPRSVDVRVAVDDPSANDVLELTVFDCNGDFVNIPLTRDSWDIVPEETGDVEVGRDTCIDAEIVVRNEYQTIDSLVSADPSITLRFGGRGAGPWRVTDAAPMSYLICYRPDSVERAVRYLTIYVRRDQPNGGLTHYSMLKPISVSAVAPPPPPEPVIVEIPDPDRPPLTDPSTFRTILVPTTVTLPGGAFFAGNFDVGGWLGGYGVTDDLMILAGGALVPKSIQEVAVGTIGVKYRPLVVGHFQAAVGFQYGYSSSTTQISAATPFLTASYGTDASRLSVAAGYAFKTHTSDIETFDENASVVTVGADVTLKRGWKLAAEAYFIEKSNLRPISLTSRWFTNALAFEVGILVDFEGTGGVRGTGTLSGEIQRVRAAPIISLIYVWK